MEMGPPSLPAEEVSLQLAGRGGEPSSVRIQ